VKDLSVGYLLTVVARREGKPVAGAVVSVRDKRGGEVFSGKTDARGEIRDIPVINTQYRQETKDPNRITMDRREPFTVSLTSGDVSVSREIAVGANQSVRIDLASAGR
jgi:hypothetical protein